MYVWSPIEQYQREKIQQIQFYKFQKILSVAKEKKIYAEKFKECSVELSEIKGIKDLHKLPFTDKDDIVEGLQKDLFEVKNENLYRWHQTSGTTGSPVKMADTRQSWAYFADLSAAALYGMGVRREDVVMVSFGYGPFIAFWGWIAGLQNIGACFVPSGGLTTTQRVKMLQSYNVTVLVSTPSYVLHLCEEASNIGVDLSKYLRLTIHTGEGCPPKVKRRIEEGTGAKAMDRPGTTETGGFAFECSYNSGLYHVQENYLIAEVIDPKTNMPVEPGETGELVLTPLYRTEIPIIRFKTKNIVKLSERTSNICDCGRSFLTLEGTEYGVIIQRLDQLTKVRGVLLNPNIVSEVIDAFKEIGEYQVVIEKKGDLEEVTLKAEVLYEHREKLETLNQNLSIALRDKLMIRCNVKLLSPGDIPKSEEKAKRILDLR